MPVWLGGFPLSRRSWCSPQASPAAASCGLAILLNKGVAAYKNAQYDAAIEDFKQAKDLDPGLMNAPPLSGHRLRQSVHSWRSLRPETSASARRPVNEFKEVLSIEDKKYQRHRWHRLHPFPDGRHSLRAPRNLKNPSPTIRSIST